MVPSTAKSSPRTRSKASGESTPKSKPAKPSKTEAARTSKASKEQRPPLKPDADGVLRLSGGNPQVAKGYGDDVVQAYIAAMPGWKKDVGKRVDAIITKAVPGVRKAVKWNSPMYGVQENHYFLGVHVFDKYVKVAFFKGASLRPLPPDASRQKDVRYYNIHEGQLDEAQFATWVKQAAALPGEKL